MALDQKPLDALDETDLQSLVDSQVSERKTIEYKSALPSDKENEKKEFLADVSSFANASGGQLIFGIEEKNGVPTKLVGLEIANADEAVRRLDDIVRQGIQPRIPGHQTHAITLQNGRFAIVMRIPRSWNAPHMITYQQWSRFYSRTSNGKYPLDVGEIRSAFLRSETQAERIRGLRADRLARIAAGDTPLPLTDAPKLVLHLVPQGAFGAGINVPIPRFPADQDIFEWLRPQAVGGSTHRYNFDGSLMFCRDWDRQGVIANAHAYTQLFRNGCIEGVNARLLQQPDGKKQILSAAFEQYSLLSLAGYLKALERLGIVPPYFAMLSMVGVAGYELAVGQGSFAGEGAPIDRDALIVPETLIENAEDNLARLMKPAFDAVWNAAGWPQSHNYDAQGDRIFR